MSSDNSGSGAAPERPEHIPEKFWKDGKVDVDGLAKSYVHLEQKLGSRPPAEVVIEREPAGSSVLEVDDALKEAGLSFEDIEASVARNGKPTEAQYKALAKTGMARSAVDRMVRAEVVLRDATTRAAIEAAGGQEQITALREWAASKESGITDAEIEAFNAAVGRGGSPDAAKSQVEYLMYKAEKSGVKFESAGAKPSLVTGQPASGGGGGFKSYSEYGKAVMDVYEGRMSREEFERRDRATPASAKSQPGVRNR